MMEIPDPIEQGEAGVDAWAHEHGDADGFTCDCGKWCTWERGRTLTGSPYDIPVCPDCFDKAFS